jgi:phosphoserine phosphatase
LASSVSSKRASCCCLRDFIAICFLTDVMLVLLAFLAARDWGVFVRSATISCVLRIFLTTFGDRGAHATPCLCICTSCVDGSSCVDEPVDVLR